MSMDLNCDMGELAEVPEEELMPLITSANIACGGHAGNDETMLRTIALAHGNGVRCGAHPGYPDPANFGREELPLSTDEIADTVFEQVTRLDCLAKRLGCALVHVKPHGALYNVAARRRDIASAIAAGVSRWRTGVVLVGLARSVMLDVWREAGFRVAAEAFADRAYEPDGSLRSRKRPDALILEPSAAAGQALRIAREGWADTICIHGDSPGSPQIAAAVRNVLVSL